MNTNVDGKRRRRKLRAIKYRASCEAPRFVPTNAMRGKQNQRRKTNSRNFFIEFVVFYYPGSNPFKKEYKVKELQEAHTFTLTLQEDMQERSIEDDIVSILEEEFPRVPIDFFRGMFVYYRKSPDKRLEIKKHVVLPTSITDLA